MTKKEASEKFGIPKNTISTWMKNKDKLFEGLEQTSSDPKKTRGCDYEQWTKLLLNSFLFKEAKTFQLMT